MQCDLFRTAWLCLRRVCVRAQLRGNSNKQVPWLNLAREWESGACDPITLHGGAAIQAQI